MASNLKIRPLRAADEAAWQQLFLTMRPFTRRKFQPMRSRLRFTACFRRSHVARLGGGYQRQARRTCTPGVAPQHLEFTPDAYLNDLFVDPTYRRHGVGRALLQEVVNTGHEEAGASYIGKPLAIMKPPRPVSKGRGANRLDDF